MKRGKSTMKSFATLRLSTTTKIYKIKYFIHFWKNMVFMSLEFIINFMPRLTLWFFGGPLIFWRDLIWCGNFASFLIFWDENPIF
jgi:hypothetical protein